MTNANREITRLLVISEKIDERLVPKLHQLEFLAQQPSLAYVALHKLQVLSLLRPLCPRCWLGSSDQLDREGVT